MGATRVPPVTYTTAEAAAAAGVTRKTATKWASSGQVDAVQVDGLWLVDGGSLLAYAGRPRPPRPARSASRTAEPRVPAEPLLRQLHLRGGPAACGVQAHSAEEKALERARTEGSLTVWAADQLAVRVLGVHPLLVWGEEFLAA